MSSLRKDQAIKLLEENNVQQNVIEHCLTVSGVAVGFAKMINARGHDIDVGFVETGALIHDIGRAKTHGIMHGIEGAKILSDFPRYARVCERHIGGGITKEEARTLGLPARDYLPETLEEEVICYADKLVHGDRITTIDETIRKFEERLGPDHPTIGRIRHLDRKMRALMENHT
jgi:uncharacterized protein